MSDADGMNNIMEKLLNVENDWDGDVNCHEMMGPCCLISEEIKSGKKLSYWCGE